MRESETRVGKSVKEVIPVNEKEFPKWVLQEHVSVFRLRLEKDDSASITLMKTGPDPKAKSVIVEIQKFQTYLRKLMGASFGKLVEYVNIEPILMPLGKQCHTSYQKQNSDTT